MGQCDSTGLWDVIRILNKHLPLDLCNCSLVAELRELLGIQDSQSVWADAWNMTTWPTQEEKDERPSEVVHSLEACGTHPPFVQAVAGGRAGVRAHDKGSVVLFSHVGWFLAWAHLFVPPEEVVHQRLGPTYREQEQIPGNVGSCVGRFVWYLH